MPRGTRRWLLGAGALGLFATLAPRGSAETELEAAATAGQSTGGWTCGPRGQARYGGVAGQVRMSERAATPRRGRGGTVVLGAAVAYERVRLVPGGDSPASSQAQHPPDSIQGGFGVRGGNDWQYFGFQLGLQAWSGWDSAESRKPTPYVLPQLELRAGPEDSRWFVAGFGSPLATTYRHPGAYVGAGVKQGVHEFDATLGLFRAGPSGFDDNNGRFDVVWKGLLFQHWGPRLGASLSRISSSAPLDWEASLGVAAAL